MQVRLNFDLDPDVAHGKFVRNECTLPGPPGFSEKARPCIEENAIIAKGNLPQCDLFPCPRIHNNVDVAQLSATYRGKKQPRAGGLVRERILHQPDTET